MFRISRYMEELYNPKPLGEKRNPPGPVVIWNLIRRCNLTCKHCYSISADHDFPGELETGEIFRVMDELKQFSVPVLILSGGEPLLHPDIYKISRRAKSMGFYVGLSTNGTLITEDNIQNIVDVGYVNQDLVHRNSANDAHQVVTEQHFGLVGKASPVTVGVSEGNDAGYGGSCCNEAAAVAYGMAGGDLLEACYRRLQFHDRCQLDRGISHRSGIVAVHADTAANHVEMGLGYFYGSCAVGGVDDSIFSPGEVIFRDKIIEDIELLLGVGKVLLVGGGKVCVHSSQMCIRAFIDFCNKVFTFVGVEAAAAHTRLDVDVQIEPVFAAGQELRNKLKGLKRGDNAIPAVLCTQQYVVGRCIGPKRFEDEN